MLLFKLSFWFINYYGNYGIFPCYLFCVTYYSNNQQDVSCLCFCFYTDYYSARHTCQQTLQSKNLLNKSAFSFVHMLTTWHCPHSVYDTTAAQHRWYQCFLPTGLTAADLQWQHAAATLDKQIDRWMPDRYRPCSAYSAGSADKLKCVSLNRKWSELQYKSKWTFNLFTNLLSCYLHKTHCIMTFEQITWQREI